MSAPLRIGERLILGFRGYAPPEWLLDFAGRFGLGGVVLFDYDGVRRLPENNVRDPAQVAALCAALRALPSRPLICVDQEGGRVRRLKETLGFAPLPSALEFHALPPAEQAAVAGAAYGELRRLGFHLNLAPVIDLNLNPASPDIGAYDRAYSADPEAVAADVAVLDAAARRCGLGLCLKHYPGLGAATADTHRELTDLTGRVPPEQLALFHDLGRRVTGGAVMLSHGIVRDWDPDHPVSVSRPAVARLRAHLPDALLITDDLQMAGLRDLFDLETACALGLRAGVDLLLIGNTMRDEQAEMAALAEALERLVAADPALVEAHAAALDRIAARKRAFAGGEPASPAGAAP